MKKIIKVLALGNLLILILLSSFISVQAAIGEDDPSVVILTADGPITQILVEYIDRGLELAGEQNADVIIIQLNTPGGSVDIMNSIVQKIRNSEIPVVVYVAPQNAMAGSAGTIVTLAGHLSAMAPETTIGAASPVGTQGEDIGETMESKVKEMLKASVRAIAKNRPPGAIHLAEDTIENAIAVTDEEALEVGLIDIRARDIDDLLTQLDGREVLVSDEAITLHTLNAQMIYVENTFIEDLLQLLINPNLVFILLAIGIQAILIELSNPGGWVAGFLGAVCLLLAIYGMGLLPVNWFGILFIVTAFILFILDVKAPTHGALTAAGAASFITGSLVLFNSVRLPGFPTVSVPLVVGTGLFIAASFFAIVSFAIRALKKPAVMGKESMPGRIGLVIEDLDPQGIVHVAGEQWLAEIAPGEEHIPAGEKVEVVSVDGLRITVKNISTWNKN